MKKERLDKILVERGLVGSRERARALILAGKVRVGDHTVSKAGHPTPLDAEITVVEPDHPYVSRGGLKLKKALEHYGVDPTGWICLDVGSSTGGFTDVLLQSGARKVFAVDVGTNQLDWRLRGDERVVVYEKENIRHFDKDKLTDPVELCVIDVSFISLTLVLPKVIELLPPGRPVIALVKPQFEVGKGNVEKGGIVRDPQARADAVQKIVAFATEHKMTMEPAIESPIQGATGNVEYLILLHTPGAC